MDHRPGPNRLLNALIFLSVGAHILLLLHLSGVYRSSRLTYIELSLQSIDRPAARAIPRPRQRPKAPAPDDPAKKISVVQRTLPRLKPLAMAPVDRRLPDSLVEGIGAPDVPRAPDVDAADFAPASPAHQAAAEFMTAASYLDMVKMKIESRKRYPESAKRQRIEGRVKVHFILATDGSVRDVGVSDGTRFDGLNTAALEAVRRAAPFPKPPSNLFKTDLALELIIVFELT